MNRKRNWIYVMLVVSAFLLVLWKQQDVIRERNQAVVSSVSEWEKSGRPVVVEEIRKKDVPLYIKVTAWQVDEHHFEGHVSKDIRDKLSIGQDMVFLVDGKEVKGSISMIAEEISIETGMYRVQVVFAESFHLEGWIIAYAHIDTMQDVMCVPNEAIDKENDTPFVWKAVDGTAVRQQIVVGQRDGYGAVVTQGLNEGDLVIIEGFSSLSEGDKVNIRKGSGQEEIKHD